MILFIVESHFRIYINLKQLQVKEAYYEVKWKFF